MTSNKIRTTILSAGICLLTMAVTGVAQNGTTATNGTAPKAEAVDENYTITSSVEFGVRGLSVNGDYQKYRSDVNYKPGFRLFDSSFNVDAKKDRFFDHALIQTSGWGGDPSGYFRGNVDKTGTYKFTSTVRRNNYYNNVLNFAPTWSQQVSLGSQHQFNTNRDMGDFDLLLRPDSENFRVRLGYSYNRNNGPGMYNIRWPSFTGMNPANFDPKTNAPVSIRGEEINTQANWRSNADDFRAGVEGKLLGFNLGVGYGHRNFRDKTTFYIPGFNNGNDPNLTGGSSANFYNRDYRTKGNTNYYNFFIQRTFADKFDFAGRAIYSVVNSNVKENDLGIGRTYTTNVNTGILLDNDSMYVTGNAKRPQTRADLALTYRATDKLRISNTFSFDQFNGTGGQNFNETLVSRTSDGKVRAYDYANSNYWRITSYHKYTNLIEADYELNRMFSFNAGYRWSHRKEALNGLPNAFNTNEQAYPYPEEAENTTHAGIFGVRVKPMKDWTIYADAEIGEADSVFTRTENNSYSTFRVRSITRFNKWTLNLSTIIRDNTNPGLSDPIYYIPTAGQPAQILFPARESNAEFRTRNFTGSIDWTPNMNWNLSAGYTYDHQTSNVDTIMYLGSPQNIVPSGQTCLVCWTPGHSSYYVRNNFFFFDLSAHPWERVTAFVSYRIDNDSGQGNLRITRPEDMISSYPMKYQTPEVRLSFKLTNRIDWDLGYRYYSYRENVSYTPYGAAVVGSDVKWTTGQQYPQQNYTAHLPYTALRIYFGRSADRRR